MKKTSPIEKYFLFALMALVLVLTVAIFYPFITVLVLGAAFAVVLNPIYIWIKKRMAHGIPWIASLITIIFFTIALCGPLVIIGNVVFHQVSNGYSYMTANGSNKIIKKIDASINKVLPSGFTFDAREKISELGTSFSGNIAKFFSSVFNSILLFIIMILTIFYVLKDGEEWKYSLIKLSPLSDEHMKEILDKLKLAINRILKGSFLIAIVQGILVGIGLTIFGVPGAAIWGLVAGMASFVPTVGTAIVTVPAVLYLYFTGMHIQALGMLLWSMLLVGMVDNFLAPYVISKNTEIPSLFILFSILGGVSLIGPVGVLIGPLVLSLLYSLISIYKEEVRTA